MALVIQFDEYQEEAAETAIYPTQYSILYPALGLANEAGEVLGKVKKVLRDHNGEFTTEQKKMISDEVGDVLWYIASLCEDLGIPLERVANNNIQKLRSRKERGKLGGSGDYR